MITMKIPRFLSFSHMSMVLHYYDTVKLSSVVNCYLVCAVCLLCIVAFVPHLDQPTDLCSALYPRTP